MPLMQLRLLQSVRLGQLAVFSFLVLAGGLRTGLGPLVDATMAESER